MNNTEIVKEAIKIIDSANKADGYTAEIDNTEVQQCLAWKFVIQMSTGEISDIRYTLEHGEEEKYIPDFNNPKDHEKYEFTPYPFGSGYAYRLRN